ncbi:glutamate ABC transporter substrate-binding protein [Antrihabitans sp. YC2-6]|uniref:glutamate ABC transporter substrate-binding protein n=1 Tax=Antrihabitans sp. YC2-6 TaxID=2799498 RepID=UPI0018F69243|nr:glutamate ABC transporter substrate-binding protein [Antrihabitans sp. YC2-6]MBJ8345015.1 glutamate ABC transporter substrate-binding protein [Antrihabitans sp. YC2-6]
MRYRFRTLAVGIAVAALTLSACGNEGSPDDANKTDKGPSPTFEVAESVTLTGSPTYDKAKAAGKLVVGVKYDQPGLGQLPAGANQPEGFDVEIAKMLAADLGFSPDQITFTETVSANREPFLQNGTVDLVVATYTINDRRKEVVDFAGPYYVAGQDLLVKKDNTDITGPESLDGKKVCSVDGSTPAQRIEEQYTNAELVTFDTYSKCVEQLTNGSVDAVTTDDAILRGYAAAQPDTLKVVGNSFSSEPYGIGLPKGDTALRTFLNESLTKHAENGDWTTVFEYTLGDSDGVSPPPVDQY